MAFINYISSVLVAIGTMSLAIITFFSILESRRKEDKADRLAIFSEKKQGFYVPILNEVFNARGGKTDFLNVLRIAYINYYLAEDETREAIKTMLSIFNKFDQKKPQESQDLMNAYLSFKMVTMKDYNKLIRQFNRDRGLEVPDDFKIPDIDDGM